jgi:hypothetical protein
MVHIRPTASTSYLGVGVAPGVVVGSSHQTEHQEVLGSEILKSKACKGVEVTAVPDKADFVLGYDSYKAIWNLYDREGKLLDSGKARRPKNVAKNACAAILKHWQSK